MLDEKTLKFIDYLEKTASDSSQGQRQEKFKLKVTKKNNAGAGAAIGAGLGALSGAFSPKYKSLGIAGGALAGAGLGRLLGRKTYDTNVQSEKQQDLKRVEKKDSNARIPSINQNAPRIGLSKVK